MAELLQTHRRVALSTSSTGVLLPIRPPAYKNVPRTHGHRAVLPDISTLTNMEDPAIEGVLNRIHSLDDLSAEDLIELRRVSERSFAIDKFKLDEVGSICSVEYDAQNARIILRGGPEWMHEAAPALIGEFLGLLRDRLSAATGSRYFLTGSIDCALAGDFAESTKQAVASLQQFGAKWLAVVLEVGISEPTSKLYQDAKRWLKGSNRQTKLVILVDVQEKPRWKTSSNNWSLSEIDFQQINHDKLSDHIFQWYRSKQILLHGSFNLSVHLWYSDDDKQCILNKAVFLPGNLIDLTTIQDVPFEVGASHAWWK
ncbi:hypothetical protein TSTA_041500 [Talaromyces stipitatus ATCC 10500]|uniref:Uncharacterized protein n=1 Tax=Talaromyces stipitatus (strain ATCC 10500 / CBS 375.48 / QM 6759 / NRRL 1006) TaxID=441959 RepID=B8MJ83_TALSN|nr:uncharacterized protein TSTA_041500 [Talaromyces stipitatus ATCC 10500]EED14672.1 hypothetical protein TSTA_041500 [Talaromyces stipitatus ATCC 10500]